MFEELTNLWLIKNTISEALTNCFMTSNCICRGGNILLLRQVANALCLDHKVSGQILADNSSSNISHEP